MSKKIIYDYSKLKGKIVEKCGTHYEFANRIGLSDRSVSFKMTSRRNWKQEEIERAITVLDIPRDDIAEYFFVPVVVD